MTLAMNIRTEFGKIRDQHVLKNCTEVKSEHVFCAYVSLQYILLVFVKVKFEVTF